MSLGIDIVIVVLYYQANNDGLQRGQMADTLFLLLFLSGPIGLGIGLTLIGTFVLLLAKANEISKRTQAFKKELEKERGIKLSRESKLRTMIKSSMSYQMTKCATIKYEII